MIVEFRHYFEHVKSLGFEDRPDYDYLKRLFRELFFRQGFAYDNLYDWDLIAQSSAAQQQAPTHQSAADGKIPAAEHSAHNNQNYSNNINAVVSQSTVTPAVQTGGILYSVLNYLS